MEEWILFSEFSHHKNIYIFEKWQSDKRGKFIFTKNSLTHLLLILGWNLSQNDHNLITIKSKEVKDSSYAYVYDFSVVHT